MQEGRERKASSQPTHLCVDAAGVRVEPVGGVDAAGDGPAGKDLGLRKGRVALGMDEGEKGREEKR